MKINSSDGSIAFPGGNITRNMDKRTFLQAPFAKPAKVMFGSEPWITFRFTPEAGVSCSATFEGERLRKVALLLSMPTDAPSNWTAELERERKLKHDSWLHAELGPPPYEYAWGNVTSEFDPRACVSDVLLTYVE